MRQKNAAEESSRSHKVVPVISFSGTEIYKAYHEQF
jgi:hypothetical protein